MVGVATGAVTLAALPLAAVTSQLAAPPVGHPGTSETIAGFAYVYAARLHWPPAGQLTGLILLITGVTLAMRHQQPDHGEAPRHERPAPALLQEPRKLP